jgi:flagellar hook-associated protein 1 FlgK
MAGLSEIFEIARRAMMSQRVAINVTSHNIANASTSGYSRQRVDLAPTKPVLSPFGLLGTGVTVASIGRIRDAFIDQQIRSSNDVLGSASTQQQILSQVEAALNEPSDSGLSALLSKLFNAFQDLAVHPEESSTRNAVLQQAVLLTQKFHGLSSSLKQVRADLFNDVNTKIARINQLATELSDLDVQITNAAAVGVDPSDAKDLRDLKLDELSSLVDVSVSEDKSGSLMISVGGTVIASRSGAVALNALIVGDQIQIATADAGIPVTVRSGQLGGVLDMHNDTIANYLARLDDLAVALIDRVNTVHAAGFGLGTPPPTGINFFTGVNAGNIAVDSSILNNINNIAASSDGSPGDNRTALALAGIANEPLMNGNTVSLLQSYNGLVSEIGTTINAVDNTAKSQGLIQQQLENQRAATSGVSLDEEMTNLIKFQRSYEAAARVITTVDDMFQTIMSMVTR